MSRPILNRTNEWQRRFALALAPVVVVVGALGIGLAGYRLLADGDDSLVGTGDGEPTVDEFDFSDIDSDTAGGASSAGASPTSTAQPAPDGAPTPEEAVIAYVTAVANDDHATAFSLVTDDARAAAGSLAGWIDQQADRRDPTGFVVDDVRVEADRAEVEGTATQPSRIDEFSGLVPARATVTWVAERSDTGWLVSLEESRSTPLYPDDSTTATIASEWLEGRVACEPVDEYDGLVGSPNLADQLCGADGPAEVDGVAALEPGASGTAVVVAAFGPEATEWARVVPITSPEPMRLVLAPVDDTWLPVAVLAP